MELYAFIGEDEFGSGEIGLKQGFTPAGLIPLAAIARSKLDQPDLIEQLLDQARTFGKPIRLVRFVAAEDVVVIDPVDGVRRP